jgi:hypothetical protein
MVVMASVGLIPSALHVFELVQALGGAEVFLQPIGSASGGAAEEVADGTSQSGPQGSDQGVHDSQSKG